MSISIVFHLMGGLDLFIYGMQQMAEGLQKAAGNRNFIFRIKYYE